MIMRALSLSAVKELTLVDMPMPIAEGNNAIIKISVSGICGTDVGM
jgi:threonine dehydrogenase-like Zn-dependent dehydrogenase